RDKEVGDFDVVAAGPAQAADVPGVVDRGRRGGEDRDALERRTARIEARPITVVDGHGDREPVGVRAAAAVGPASADPEAAVAGDGAAIRRSQGAGGDGLWIAPEDLLADLRRQKAGDVR